ncbi:MAG TPA: VTT domain-containing protein [Mycobacteriales bacterium]|nr:VTT domain-containing protein [Mycobacteriales bacterium]
MTLAIGPEIGFDSASAVAIYLIVWVIVFIESGLLIGFFLPGDTLLFAAGVACAGGRANVAILCAGVVVAAIVGDSTGYAIGRRMGRPLLERRDGRVLNQRNLRRATEFYDKYGSATIVIARVVPVVRTFAPLIAGCTEMRYRTFLTWNILGGIAWGVGVPVAGYVVGETIPGLEKYALAAAGFMVLVSIVPAVIHYVQAGRQGEPEVGEEQVELIEDALDD